MRWKRGSGELQEVGVLGQVAHERALARVAEPGHPVLHVGDEALPRLLAVVADVDADLHLRWRSTPRWPPRWRARSSSGSTASPRLRRPCISASAAGRGRLPAWVVRIRDVARRAWRGVWPTFRRMSDVRPAGPEDRELVARIAAEGFFDDPVLALGVPRRRPPARAAGGAVRRAVRRHGPRPRHRPPARRRLHRAVAPTRLRRGATGQRAPRGRRPAEVRRHPLLRRGDRAAHRPRRA